ncbi:MAG: DUF493 family protein [Spirochaetes bacterium]|nr:DUF493 family protein [Spirochaetota bacterium]
MSNSEKNEIEFPCEITMKIIFRNIPNIRESVKSCLNENIQTYTLDEKSSKNSTFLSFTLCSVFSTKNDLDEICTVLKSVDGYQTMF